jgi:hypothetical protein
MLDMLNRVLAAWRGNLCVANYTCAAAADEGGSLSGGGHFASSERINAKTASLSLYVTENPYLLGESAVKWCYHLLTASRQQRTLL